jgi:hypothetical protein
MSDQFAAKAASYTTNNQHKTQTFVSLVEFETLIAGIECPQSYALDHTAFRELAQRKTYGNPL